MIKAVRVDEALLTTLNMWREAIASQRLTNLAGLLLETASRKGVGGTGEANNWPAILQAKAAGAFDDLPPLIAAGGLTPENVAQAVREVQPFGVDVSSGVESSPGKKDHQWVRAFIRAAKAAADEKLGN